ncbi:MAG: putative cobalt-precorrin-6A synthase (deacetylating) [Methanosaeta sp. PtaU1.Bin112]|nr:MAG: putative cobalt-precorrin-6A synthase (deacetylating) [Methanosaeta sp. PtaU1.Bin112]
MPDPKDNALNESARDPVTGFAIPASWIELSSDPLALQKIKSGRWVILSSGQLCRRGLTTGTTAAAACKGAVLSLKGPVCHLQVATPAGIIVTLEVAANSGTSIAVKDGGDHQFDVTAGLEILAQARPAARATLIAGKGIGRISARGLCDEVGRPAISPSARKQIMLAIEQALEETGLPGAEVQLSIPRGAELAEKTLNPKLGVVGGISILGSTGFVEPWNDHYTGDRASELKGSRKVLVTTGRTGLNISRILFPDHKAVLMGSQLDRLAFEKDQESILCGLPALILKWAWPGVLDNTGYGTVAEMVEAEPEHPNIVRAVKIAKEKLPQTRIVLLHRDGRILADVP